MVAFVGIGGFTTDLVAKETRVSPLPAGMDFYTASSFLVVYGTADYALRVSYYLIDKKLRGEVRS